ncbi:hypothetical protein PUNSTDRAFT_90611 [Punctularia strigosozonata HHB-11173 SS5]|uniref:uncharacterized protein n=1 Tax=Punctularia strigosozonata (strain HHB-11173) TaxID=741275 RepID=UPI00044169EE|nr:uncharacterized protein PUNSTDRAFT_90611 [Punctularia strigosozonata HHB-11173 SS5]EIN06874.1 hypothetical protein PUNSTDRAFT_90611 [Punctularia strigosozonata HHB-11173 SS5]
MLRERMDEADAQARAAAAAHEPPSASAAGGKNPTKSKKSWGPKSARVDEEEKEASATVDVDAARRQLEQPALVTGAKMKDYQLQGLAWMKSLYENGISGILADEMGLGKTLQTIAFAAFLREHMVAPFLVVCPLSVLHNWGEEFKKFAPDIPVCLYHGTPAERAELRRTAMSLSLLEGRNPTVQRKAATKPKAKRAKRAVATVNKQKARAATRPAAPSGSRSSGRLRGKARKTYAESDDDESEDDGKGDGDGEGGDEDPEVEDPAPEPEPESEPKEAKALKQEADEDPLAPARRNRFPVVVTTYEMIIKDRQHLAHYRWGYIVVDEGHRLKNFDSKLMQEIKKYESAGRMILTGTPLHNNLSELWSLLNFILPDIFGDLDSFQQWFNLPTLQSTLPTERSSGIINSLHAILKPFLLRRVKADVMSDLPPKKEYVLYAPLTEQQRSLYDAVVGGGLRALLLKNQQKGGGGAAVEKIKADLDVDAPRKMRSGKRKKYDLDSEDDDEYFERLEKGGPSPKKKARTPEPKDAQELGKEWALKAALKQVNNMKLQNTIMQLRKVCSHPFLFHWPTDPRTHAPVMNEDLVDASGKMMVLERLLDELFRRKHKVLIFSQFTTMLDIIEDWARELKGWELCRIDGSTAPAERREEMNRFQNGGDDPDAPKLFLLSTRSGGLGINLTAADTVIFYDQDWNPQMDLQAQDRAHRIGQTKPVLVFRLVSKHTVETKIMQRAAEKRQLEALVIAKGKFKMPAATTTAAAKSKPETIAEMAAALLKLEGERIEVVPSTAAGKASVISDEDMEMLLDRRPEVFADRGQGWNSEEKTSSARGQRKEKGGERQRAAFAVYEAPVDEGNDVLAKMLGEETE